ncbi:hypothetical protein [Actinoplanes rectilineatus]|uniref:hypothetical protein n=1 Tax=Actinoplanes rectilineatus TaxID=113571 RepID=UPI000696E382|nr:hypothetical protein [Actinoplanes rectilineatus]
MEERRKARVGTVSGLALLTGATALVAVAGGHHSIFATLLLGLLSLGMSHALIVEIQRQARRRTRIWGRHDTVNTMLLAAWSMAAVALPLLPLVSDAVRLLGAILSAGYAAACAYFVVERRRTIVSLPIGVTSVDHADTGVPDDQDDSAPHAEWVDTAPHHEPAGTTPYVEQAGAAARVEQAGAAARVEQTSTAARVEQTGTAAHAEPTGTSPAVEAARSLPDSA